MGCGGFSFGRARASALPWFFSVGGFLGGGVGFGCGVAVVVRDGFVSLSGEFFRSFVTAVRFGGARVLAEVGLEWDFQFEEAIRVVAARGLVVLGNFFDHVAGLRVDAGAGVIFHGNVEGAQNQRGALHVDGVAQQRIDDFGQRGLDGLFVLDAGEWVQARLPRRAHAAMHALVVVAELLSAEREESRSGRRRS